MERVITIDAPHFNAGVVLHGTRCIDAAPIVRYMIGWRIDKIQGYCQRKGWKTYDSSRPDLAGAISK